MLFDQGQALGGLTYQVTSLINAPSEQALDTAPLPPAVIKDNYLEVPASYNSLRALAKSIAGKAKTPLDKAVALQDWLADGSFKYTLKAPTVLDASELSQFLNSTKSGYCQQFSFAMAVLARLLGIPSRVAYGFTSGSPVGDNEWQVTTHDAHAWPELYFSGYGWLRFEPTPSGSAGQGTAYAPTYTTESGGPSTGASSQSAPTAAPSSAAGNSRSRALLRHHLSEQLGDGAGLNQSEIGNTAAATNARGTNPWKVVGLVVAGLLILALVAPWAARLAIQGGAALGIAMPTPRPGADPGRRRVGARGLERAPGTTWRTTARAACRVIRRRACGGPRGGNGAGPGREPALAALGRDRHGGGMGPGTPPRPTDGSGLRHDSVTVRPGHRRRRAAPHPVAWQAAAHASVIGPALGGGGERNWLRQPTFSAA